MSKTRGRFSIHAFHMERKLLRVASRVAAKSYAISQPLQERPDYGSGNSVSVPKGEPEGEKVDPEKRKD